jgi:multisubunit Na+/H+ antiporter MnhB subunit
MSTTHHPEDRGAAFTGLIVGAVALIIIVLGIVKLTNAKFASHEKPVAEANK